MQPDSRDLCNSKDSDKTTKFLKKKSSRKAIFNKVNTVDRAAGLYNVQLLQDLAVSA